MTIPVGHGLCAPANGSPTRSRAYEVARQEWPWVTAVCFWAFRFPWDAKSYQDYFTFVDTDFEPKPIYQEVQNYTQGSGGQGASQRLDGEAASRLAK